MAKSKKKKRSLRAVLAGAVAMATAGAILFSTLTPSTALAASVKADEGTKDNYDEVLGGAYDTENSGQLWADKSVSTTGTNVAGSQVIEKNEDADFQIIYSLLGTEEQIMGQTSAPIDLVFVIDVSGSMVEASRMKNTVEALNNSMDKVLKMNENARVGIMAFSSTYEELLPLAHYKTKEDGKYLSYTNGWGGPRIKGTLEDNEGNLKTVDKSVTGGTNTQVGIYGGMYMLASEKNTTVQVDSTTLKRIPVVILLSDGVPTYSSNSAKWWQPGNNSNNGPGGTAYYGNGIKAMAVASYMKEAINRNYQGTDTSQWKDAYKVKVYTVGLGITSLDRDEKNLSYMTLDPKNHWDDSNDMAEYIRGDKTSEQYEGWKQYLQGNSITVRVNKNSNNNSYKMKHPSQNDITSLQYNDGYYDAADASNVQEVFNDILSDITMSIPHLPTYLLNEELADQDGYVTYLDPIGQYLDVKSMDALVYNGAVLTAVSKTTEENQTVTLNFGMNRETEEQGQDITLTGAAVDNYVFSGQIQTPMSGQKNASIILVQVITASDEDAEYADRQFVQVKVPASAIPMRISSVTLNQDGSVKENGYSNNGFEPLRLLYSVGIKASVDLETYQGVDDNYVEENTVTDVNGKKMVNFYANYFSGHQTFDGQGSYGDALATFVPAVSNKYYYVQKDHILYTDAECTQPATGDALDADTTYYYKQIYYEGQNIKEKLYAYKGSEFSVGTVSVITVDGETGLGIRKGVPRTENMREWLKEKDSNLTETADLAQNAYGIFTNNSANNRVEINLGNNGLLQVDAPNDLLITKKVTAEEGLTAPDREFTFHVTLDSKKDGRKVKGTKTLADGQQEEIVLDFNENGEAELNLKADETVMIPNVRGSYIVEEKITEAKGFTLTKIEDDGQNGTVTKDLNAGTAEGETKQNEHSVELTFTNNYSAKAVDSTELPLEVFKELEGRDWKDGDKFSIRISGTATDENGVKFEAPLPEETVITITNQTEGHKASFGKITFTRPGTYIYNINEKNPHRQNPEEEYIIGVSYDPTIYILTVNVADDGEGNLKIESSSLRTNEAGSGEEKERIVFCNVYASEEENYSVYAGKDYTSFGKHGTIEDGKFRALLKAEGSRTAGTEDAFTADEDQPMPTSQIEGSNMAEVGNVERIFSFGNATFTVNMVGKEYKYTLQEMIPDGAVQNGDGKWVKDGITYDSTVYTCYITVTSVQQTIDGIEKEVVEVNVKRLDPEGNELESVPIFRNEYKAEGTASLAGTKELKGREFKQGDKFEFQVTPVSAVFGDREIEDYYTDGKIDAEKVPMPANRTVVTDAASGTEDALDFGEIFFTQPGVYTYKLTEKDEKAGGITYDTAERTVVYTVTDQKNGTLGINAVYYKGTEAVTELKWTNVYSAEFDKETAVSLDGTKKLHVTNSNMTLKADDFYFITENVAGAPMGGTVRITRNETGSGSNGEYEAPIKDLLKNIVYTEEGTYEYLIQEQIPQNSNSGMIYDRSWYKITVTVTDDLEGRLYVSNVKIEKSTDQGTTYTAAEKVTFENIYQPQPASYTTNLGKRLLADGRVLQKDEFEFELKVDSAKDLNGRDYGDDHGIILPNGTTAKNDVPGTGIWASNEDTQDVGEVSFGTIQFTKPGVYVLSAREKIPADAEEVEDGIYKKDGIYYSTNEAKATYRVTESNGQLSVVRIGLDGSEIFVNTYETSGTLDGAANLEIQKSINGRDWQEGDVFTFELALISAKDLSGNAYTEENSGVTLPTSRITIAYEEGKNAEDYKEHFGDITFIKTGIFEFAIREQTDNLPKGVSGAAERRVFVRVTDENNNGELTATVSKIVLAGTDTAADMQFVNEYAPEDPAVAAFRGLKKVLQGKTWNGDSFTFHLAAVKAETPDGAPITEIPMPAQTTVTVSQPTSENEAEFEFGEIRFTQAGTYYYEVTEEKGNNPGIVYSTNKATFKVTVADNLQGAWTASVTAENTTFTNVYSTEIDYDAKGGMTLIKELDGRSMEARQFGFTIRPEDESSAAKADLPLEGQTVYNQEAQMNVAAGKSTDIQKILTGMLFTQDDAGKVYRYQIWESQKGTDGYTNDESVYHVAIETQDDGNGTLTVTTRIEKNGVTETYVYSAAATETAAEVMFENAYDAEGNLTLIGTKILTGRTQKAGEFTFVLKNALSNLEIENVTNKEDGTIELPMSYTIDSLNADLAKGYVQKTGNVYTYQYTLTEDTNGLPAGVTPIAAAASVKVKITDNGNGNLSVAAEYADNADSMYFENAYGDTEVAEIGVNGKKVLEVEDQTLTPPDITGKYTFILEGEDEKTPLPQMTEASNQASGTVEFGKISFTMEDLDGVEPEEDGSRTKTFIYTVTEQGTVPGVTNDSRNPQTFTVVLTDDGEGHLSAKAGTDGEPKFLFTNIYSVTPLTVDPQTELGLHITKILTGRDLTEGEFRFELRTAEGEVVAEASNRADGTVVLPKLTFTKPGTYSYQLSECNDGKGGVGYDGKTYTVVIVVTDQQDGTLKAVLTEATEKNITFENTYTAEPTYVTLEAGKILKGRDLKEEEFTFELKDVQGNVVASATNTKDGKVSFEKLKFEEAGDYVYTISEKAGDKGGVTYDEKEYRVTIHVRDSLEGYLTAETESEEGMIFTNAYTAKAVIVDLTGTKSLSGRSLKDGEFRFRILDENGMVVSEGTNDTKGTILFDALKFSNTGHYAYTVSEKDTGASGIVYDKTVYQLDIEVTDNGEGQLEAKVTIEGGKALAFSNRYVQKAKEKENGVKPVKTGDVTNLYLWSTVLLLAGTLAVVSVIKIRRKKR